MTEEKDNKDLATRIVEEARSFRGTRWQHQGRLKGFGIDCAGFIVNIAINARTGISLNDSEVQSVADELQIPNNYRRRSNGEELLRLLKEHMINVPKEEMVPGDVLALCDEALHDRDIPRHLVIVTEINPYTVRIIHASEHGVVEHRMDSHWQQRVISCWRIQE